MKKRGRNRMMGIVQMKRSEETRDTNERKTGK